ncbi:S9 family peptidase [Aureibacillus halotolerans]|uniref:Dipeptidyl aminopeptidase/acylaminoacyl peptidase n=1 Tax=Aureibacillus halotolerans TaxID=1508390 RepID=A0A4R6TUF9_9BACI|nr:S9 family peptidase [Aureibacillus halotolerans]TDQ36776.1 dipeptidyl aminopeptidase/acylaminoacyl peptidase [Aureibacillus halotolerans]
MNEKRGVTAKDLYTLRSVADPSLAPGGEEAVYVLTTMNEERGEYEAHLYHLKLEGEEAPVSTQWTYGEAKNTYPRWSPDGQQLVFLSDRNGSNQLYVLHRSGGEARQLTDEKQSVSRPIWSPDGTKIAFSMTKSSSEEEKEDEQNKKDEKEHPKPHVVDKMKYKSDGQGLLKEEFAHVYVIDVENGNVEAITEGPYHLLATDWSPDSKQLVVIGTRQENTDEVFTNDVYVVDVASKQWKQYTNEEGQFSGAVFSPDGGSLAMFGTNYAYKNASLPRLFLLRLADGEKTYLTQDLDQPLMDLAIGDFHQHVSAPGIHWQKDSRRLFVPVSEHGNSSIYTVSIDGAWERVLRGEHHIYGLSYDAESQQALLAVSTPTHPGDVYLWDASQEQSTLTSCTEVNEEAVKQLQFSTPESFWFKTSDQLDVQGWIIPPVGYKEGTSYPLIVEVHGGPHAMYANTYFHEFQVLASKGYGILYCNPRGSHGYGQDFVDAVRGDYGGGDYRDVMELVDDALATYNWIDKTRIGLTGGSYGGFMTNWAIGHTDRFKAAVTQRSISNWVSFYGVSDIGYYFTEWQIKSDLDDVETLWNHSPLKYVDQMQTPLLIMHGENDDRCPIEQAEQLYIALKRKGRTTTFIRFPKATHNLSRTGHPHLRIARLDAIGEWFDEYL